MTECAVFRTNQNRKFPSSFDHELNVIIINSFGVVAQLCHINVPKLISENFKNI